MPGAAALAQAAAERERAHAAQERALAQQLRQREGEVGGGPEAAADNAVEVRGACRL